MYKRLKPRCTTHEHMREAEYRKYVFPIVYEDEKFVQISSIISEVKDYYWISNLGRIYSGYGDNFIASDLLTYHTHTKLSRKDGTSKVYDIREIYYQAFNKHYNYNQ